MKKTFIPFILLLLAVNILNISCSKEVLILPGETLPASDKLVKMYSDIKHKLKTPIYFYVSQDPSSTNALTRDNSDNITIYLPLNSDRDIQEAIAAHELGHVFQHLEKYEGIALYSSVKAKYPDLGTLATAATSLITDTDADRRAKSYGFDVSAMLEQQIKNTYADLDKIDSLRQKGYVEASNWNNLYSWINDLANGKQVSGETPLEVYTLINSLRYADFKARLSPYNLYTDLGTRLMQASPVALNLGEQIYNLVIGIGLESREQCNQAVYGLAQFLNLPSTLFVIIF